MAPELVFDTGLGDPYVLRTGGQAIGPVVTGSVEYIEAASICAPTPTWRPS
ncbi:hypothetical protein [Streptomyces nojiriensis]|uniref:hypothetical protein n=1 Tax=Streptomyces nojiriensis TaxID=66374 RepID=UPI0035DA5D70